MKIPQSGLRIDSPAWPLLQSQVTYWAQTSAAGNAFGTTLVCADLANFPSYVGMPVKILSGAAEGLIRQIAVDDGAGTLTVAAPFTNAAGAVQQILAGTRFCILSSIGGAGPTPPAPPSPGVGLWMFGECAPDMAASQTVVRCPNLAGLGDDLFNVEFYMQVIHNDSAPGVAPETEIRQITDYVSATGSFTVNAFTANVEANDKVCVFHELIYLPSVLIQNIFDIVNALFRLAETGSTLTADGTEQIIVQVEAPMGVFEPDQIKIDCGNLNWGDTIILRTYERLAAAGAYIQTDELILDDIQSIPAKIIELEPNRHGVRVTLEQTAGTNRAFVWEYLYKN